MLFICHKLFDMYTPTCAPLAIESLSQLWSGIWPEEEGTEGRWCDRSQRGV